MSPWQTFEIQIVLAFFPIARGKQDTEISIKLTHLGLDLDKARLLEETATERLAAGGYSVRTLISYGEEWFAWYMQRLAERPANVLFTLRALLQLLQPAVPRAAA